MLMTGGGRRPQTLRWHLMPPSACVGQVVPPALQGDLPQMEGLYLWIRSYVLVSLILSL